MPPGPGRTVRSDDAHGPATSTPMEISNNQNPLGDLVPAEVYNLLEQHNLLNEKGVRDYQIRQLFRSMRDQHVPAYEAIEELREQHPYLPFDTIRKIVYGLRRRS